MGIALIIEDDSSFAQGLARAIEAKGVEVVTTAKTEEARHTISTKNVDLIFVDCLLPNESGVDFVKNLRKTNTKIKVIFMSGVLTDPAFVKDTIRSTQASAFLKKPFDLSLALEFVPENIAITAQSVKPARTEEVSPRKSLYMLFGKETVGAREKRKAIEALDEIHGFDLPYLYSLLSETKSSGHLNIVKPDGDVSGISFSEGRIVAVDVVDEGTFLGKLLIDAGFILPDDLQSALNSTNPKKIGEKLILGNFLSPHGFMIALENQMNIRLSRTIQEEKIKVNFVASEIALTEPSIDLQTLETFLHDWVASKLSIEWLKAHYVQWGDYKLIANEILQTDEKIRTYPLLSGFPGMIDLIARAESLNKIFDSKVFSEIGLYKAIHFLLIRGYLRFEKSVDVVNSNFIHYKKIIDQFYGKNRFEIYEVICKIVGGVNFSLESVKTEFFKILGPAPEPGTEADQLYRQVADLAMEAFLSEQSGGRTKMKEDLARTDMESKLKASGQFEEAKMKLQKGQFSEALRMIEKSLEIDPKISKIRIYLCWAKLAAMTAASNKAQVLKEVEIDLMQVPPEEKFEAIFNFVYGLYHKTRGDFSLARKSMEKAIHLDSDLIVARRELTYLVSQDNKNKKSNDVLNADLKDLVSNFFKKK